VLLRRVIVGGMLIVIATVLLVSFTVPLLEIRNVKVDGGSIAFTLRNHGLLRDCLIDVEVISPPAEVKEPIEFRFLGYVRDGKIIRIELLSSICVDGLSEVEIGGPLGSVKINGKDGAYSISDARLWVVETNGRKYVLISPKALEEQGGLTNMDKLKIELVFQSGRKIPIETVLTKAELTEGNIPSFEIIVKSGVE
jgi:hypothetical protein